MYSRHAKLTTVWPAKGAPVDMADDEATSPELVQLRLQLLLQYRWLALLLLLLQAQPERPTVVVWVQPSACMRMAGASNSHNKADDL